MRLNGGEMGGEVGGEVRWEVTLGGRLCMVEGELWWEVR